jgi:DNA-binding NtrC family response regulator
MLVRGAGEEPPLAGRFLPALQAVLRPPDRTSLHGRQAVLVVVPEHADPAGLARDVVAAAGRAGTSVSVGIAPFPAAGTTPHALIDAARHAAEQARPGEVVIAGAAGHAAPGAEDAPVVASAAMEGLVAAARRVAAHAVPVLLTGETGTGKEVLARRIHAFSGRAAEPFRAVNCGSIPQTLLESTLFGHEKGAFTGADRRRLGIFEVAHRGTLFLDEIGELSPPAQASLLRAIETGRVTRVGGSDEIEVDVRLLAATHRDLERMCERGDFRWDLLYRLNTVVLEVPPLRERLDEIEPLAHRFLDEAAARSAGGPLRIAAEALDALRAYHFPGNVRELRNVIERAVVMTTSGEIRPEDLPPRVRQPRLPAAPAAADPEPAASAPAAETGDLRDKLAAYERRLILSALEQAGGNQSEAARRLGLPRRTLSSKLATYGIKKRFEADE